MSNTVNNSKEIDVKGLFKLLNSYKWFIISMMFLFFIVASVWLFFMPSVFSASSIIEVKTESQQKRLNDDFIQNAFSAYDQEIEKEIEVLKTFNINEQVIDKVNYGVQVYVQDGYRKSEVYSNALPISIENINIIDEQIFGKLIKLTPEKQGFNLEVEHSLKTKFFKGLNNQELVNLDSKKHYQYNELIKTDYFALTVVDKQPIEEPIYFRINGDSRLIYEDIINKSLTISQLNLNAPLIQITYEDTIPDRATNYVNSLVEAFLEQSIIEKTKQNNKVLQFVNEQLVVTKEKLDESQSALESYRVETQILQSSTQADSIIKELSALEIKLSDNQLKSQLVNYIVKLVQNRETLDSIGPSLIELGDNTTIRQLNALQELELKKGQLEGKYTGEFPEVMGLEDQIEGMRGKILQNVKSLRSTLQYKIGNLNSLKSKLEGNLKKLPTKEKELANLTRKYEVNSNMYQYLLKKKSENEMIKAATISDYKVVEKAYTPTVPLKPRRSLILLTSLFLGLIMGMLLAMIHNAISNRVDSAEDIEKSSKLPIYGVIPFLKQRAHKIEVFEQRQSAFADGYRRLRTDLELLLKGHDSKVVLLTSMSEGDGKSNVAVNLSAVCQLAGFKSIIVDLDLRKPTLHQYFDIEQRFGMSSYLSGEDNIGDVIFSTVHPNLDIITSGTLPSNPSELLLSSRLPKLLTELKREYDYVIIDSSAIGSVTDTLSIMKLTDVNLIVFKRGETKKSAITKLEKIIEKYQINNVGLILNRSKESLDRDSLV